MAQNTVISGPFTDLAKSKEMMKEDIICSQFPVDNNMDTAHLSQIPESLAQTGMVDANMAVSSKGYVTLGQAHSFPASPTSSPNLSTTSNDSLISKSNRTPVRLNVSKSASQENLPLSSPPGYVSFKSGEPVVCETTGYVTIGTVYPDTTNYVKMGVQTLEKSDSPVYI